MALTAHIEQFWQSYLSSLGDSDTNMQREIPQAWGFGNTPQMADELGQLVYQGIKTATCSLLWEYEFDGGSVPQAGDVGIVTDGQDNPLCIIETFEVQIKPFNQVEAQFAYDEGEGDRSLAYWRNAHWHYFSEICEKLGMRPDENMPLVCERFRVVWRV